MRRWVLRVWVRHPQAWQTRAERQDRGCVCGRVKERKADRGDYDAVDSGEVGIPNDLAGTGGIVKETIFTFLHLDDITHQDHGGSADVLDVSKLAGQRSAKGAEI